MNRILSDIIQEIDNTMKAQGRETGTPVDAEDSVTYTRGERSVRMESADDSVVLFDVISPDTEFPYKSWVRAENQISQIAQTAIRLLDEES